MNERGVYERPDGEIFIVKISRQSGRPYAKRMIKINAERLNENDDGVNIEFEYDGGAVYTLTADMKMDFERAKALSLQYRHCIVCGAGLKAKKSVEAGIGPQCAKNFG